MMRFKIKVKRMKFSEKLALQIFDSTEGYVRKYPRDIERELIYFSKNIPENILK